MRAYFYNQGFMFEPEEESEWKMLWDMLDFLQAIKIGDAEELSTNTGSRMELGDE